MPRYETVELTRDTVAYLVRITELRRAELTRRICEAEMRGRHETPETYSEMQTSLIALGDLEDQIRRME